MTIGGRWIRMVAVIALLAVPTGCNQFDAAACLDERPLESGGLSLPDSLQSAEELIWIGDGRQVFAIDPGTGASATLDESDRNLRLHSKSPDDSAILATGECRAPNLFLLRTDGGDLVQLTSRVDPYHPIGFTSDGSAVLTWRDDVDFDGDVWRVDLESLEQTMLTGDDVVIYSGGSVSSDGSIVAAARPKSEIAQHGVFEINSTSGATHTLLPPGQAFTDSPARWADGTVVFVSSTSLGALAPDGQLAEWKDLPAPLLNEEVLHSAAFDRIAYVTADGVYVAGSGGNPLASIDGPGNRVRPIAWSPDGERLLVARYQEVGAELVIVNLGADTEEVLHVDELADDLERFSAVWADAP